MKKIYIVLCLIIMLPNCVLLAQVIPLGNVKSFEDNLQRELSLFADGSVQSVLESPQETSSATGSLGISIQYPFVYSSLQVSAMGTENKVSSSYGSSILNARGGSGFSGFGGGIRWLPREYSEIRYGLHGHAFFTNSTWLYEENEYGASIREFGVQFTGQYDDNFGTDGSNPLTIIFDIGLTHRSLAGNIANSNRSQIRESILGKDQLSWTGLDIGITLKLHQISARGSYLHFGGEVDGLSGGQILTTISVKSAILSDKSTRK